MYGGDKGGIMDLWKREPTGANRYARYSESGKEGVNIWGHMRQKRARGAVLQGPIGTLGGRLRTASKRSVGMYGGGRWEWAISRWIVYLR